MRQHERSEGEAAAHDEVIGAGIPGRRSLTDRLLPYAGPPVQQRAGLDAAAVVQQSRSTGQLACDLCGADDYTVHAAAARGIERGATSLPYADAIQRSFGRHDVSSVQAHVGGEATSAARAMGAEAYATGDHVAFAGAPSLHTAAHEAAHVVQQRAGVHLKGGVGEVGDPYERHADAVADLVVRGESAESLLDTMAGDDAPRTARSGPVQRKMGMEMEVGRRVTTAGGADIEPGDTDLLDHEFFKVVSDHRPGYTNLEFVMKPFDQLAGTEEEALAALDARLAAIVAFKNLVYANDDNRALSTIAGVGNGEDDLYRPFPKDPADADAGHWGDARIAPTMDGALPHGDSGQRKGRFFCHFTVGYPIGKMFQAMSYLAGNDAPAEEDGDPVPRTYDDAARARLGEAVQLANTVAGLPLAADLDADQLAELRGMVALAYTQLAAFVVKRRGGPDGGESPRQIKNLTPVVSRVRLRHVFNTMSAPVQQALHDNSAALIQRIADTLAPVAAFNGADTRNLPGVQGIRLDTYANSAFGRSNAVSQQRVFGGMHELGGADNEEGRNLIPIEIRSFRQQLMTIDEVRASAAALLRDSRQLILPPAQPQAAAQVDDAAAQPDAQAANGDQAVEQPVELPPMADPVPMEEVAVVAEDPPAHPPQAAEEQALPVANMAPMYNAQQQQQGAALNQALQQLAQQIQAAMAAPLPDAKRRKPNPFGEGP